MANTSAIWQQMPPNIYHPLNKSHTKNLNEKCLRFFCKKKRQGNGPLAEKMTRQREQDNHKRGDRKGESNNSPELPDRERTSNIFRLPLGGQSVEENPHTPLTQHTYSNTGNITWNKFSTS